MPPRRSFGSQLTGGLIALGAIALLTAAFEWAMIGLSGAPRAVSCEALLKRPVPRWVEASGCALDLKHAFIVYEGNTAIAYVPLLAGERRHPRGEADVVLVSRVPEVVEQVLDERRPDRRAAPVLVGARWTWAPDGERLDALQERYDGLARHTQYVLHDEAPDRTLAVFASLGSLALVPGLLALLWRRRRSGGDVRG